MWEILKFKNREKFVCGFQSAGYTHPSFFLYLSAFPEIPAYLFGSLLPKVNLIAFYEKCLQSICNNSLYIYFLTILYIPYYAIRARTVKVY